jgi:hypothetical protein
VYSGRRRTVEFIHFLFEDYSKRDLTKATDRCVAISGLEARIARELQCDSRYGIFQKHLHRNLLWQTLDNKDTYKNHHYVPSWSWMARSGGVQFMNIKIGSVSWVDTLRFDKERDYALVTDVGRFWNCTMEPNGNRYTILDISTSEAGWMRYDVEDGGKGTENHCVVVGRTEDFAVEEHYYILIVVPTEDDGEYKRVGVGMVRADRVEGLRADVRIV